MKKEEIIERISHIGIVRNYIDKIITHFEHSEICNINRDFTLPSQKTILFAYKSIVGVDVINSHHALYYHQNQMIKVMIEKGWSVDLCDCLDRDAAKRLCNKDYKLILGQGPSYLDFCRIYPNAKKVLFCTENNPVVVKQKFEERVKYFKSRHPSLQKYTQKRRITFFTEEHLKFSDEIILMSSEYNEHSFHKYFDHPLRINVNAILNNEFNPNLLNDNINLIRKNFVVFGCTGVIHKGIDILLDAFKQLPNCNLFIYGITKGEKNLYNALKNSNTFDCGFIQVTSPEFIKKIVRRALFVILPSCSEGMSSGVATCMCHGLIPIITKECGFDYNNDIEVLPDYRVETVRDVIQRLEKSTDEELRNRRRRLLEYSSDHFSLTHFTKSFRNCFEEVTIS